jgi:peptide/nickel transport system substrate-binding protein
VRLLLRALLACSLFAVSAPVSAQPAATKTVTIALAHEPDRFYNPTTVAGMLAANLLFDPLVGLDDQMRPYPVLAAEVPGLDNGLLQLSGDGGDRRLIVTMPLRQDVTWSDGEPFNADDVVYMWQLMMNPQSGFDTTVEDKLKSVDKVDDFTVRFTYLSANEARALDPDRYRDVGQDPVVDPLYFFGLYDAPAIYPRHKLREIVGDDPRHSAQAANIERSDFATHSPVGTGPYVLANWDPGNSLSFSSRGLALSQRLGKPAVDNVVLRVMPDKNDSLTALSAGQVQAIAQDALDAGDAPVLDSYPGVQPHYTPGNAWEQLTFNLDTGPLADPAVRQAFAYAINRKALNDEVFNGKAEIAVSQVPSWSWAFKLSPANADFNAAQAEQTLDRAGWKRGADGVRAKDGQRLSFHYWSTPASFRPSLMAMIKDQLASVGIELAVDVFPSSTFFDTSPSSPQALVSRQFDVVEFAWVSAYDPGVDALYTVHSASVPTKTNGYRGGNYGDYKNPRSDQLLNQAQNSVDPNFRYQAFAEAQGIWQSDLPVLPLLLRPVTTATSPSLVNFKPTPSTRGETWNVEQWDLAAPTATP